MSSIFRDSWSTKILGSALGLFLFAAAVPCHAQATTSPASVDRDAVNNTGSSAVPVAVYTDDSSAVPAPAIAAQPATPATESATVATPPLAAAAAAPADPASSDSNWHFTVSPYLWFSGIHGTARADGHTANISATPGDLLSHFRFGIMGLVDTSYKRVVLPLDVVWVRLGDDRAILDNTSVANLKGSEFILTPKIGYRVLDLKALKVDALTGFRYWHYGQSVSFTTNTLNFSSSQNWVDPLVGGRITGYLSPKVAIVIAGDVGGWGAGSQLDYQAVGMLGYRIKPALALQVGYRYLFVDYRNGFSGLNLTTSGVVAGVSITLK
jgi:hypothetical protein